MNEYYTFKIDIADVLKHIQSQCTGLFYNRYTNLYEPVVIDSYTFKTVHIGNLLGLQENYYDVQTSYYDQVTLFPNNKTLSEMMNDPIEFDKWYKLLPHAKQGNS